MIGSTFAVPSGIANLVLASTSGVSTLGSVEVAAAIGILVAGISGIVAVRALSRAPRNPGLTPPASAVTEYPKAA